MRLISLLLTALGISILGPASAQSSPNEGRTYRVAYLAPSKELEDLARSAMLPSLSKLGFIEGRNLVFDSRIETGARLSSAAQALVHTNPDVVVTIGPPATLSVRQASASIPIVMFSDDPVRYGLTESLAKPRQNITGVAHMAIELHGKRLELLHHAFPDLKRVGLLLRGPDSWAEREKENVVRSAASDRKIELAVFWSDSVETARHAVYEMRASGVEAAIIGSFPGFAAEAQSIADAAVDANLPIMCPWPDSVRSGCVLGYGAAREAIFSRLARYVGRLLRGAEVADLPIELPMHFELGVNLAIARQLSINFPDHYIALAEEVVD